MQYSIAKGLSKGLISVMTVAGAWLAFVGFSDVQLWPLIENYLKPLVGSMTVGGLIAMAVNYLKVRSKAS